MKTYEKSSVAAQTLHTPALGPLPPQAQSPNGKESGTAATRILLTVPFLHLTEKLRTWVINPFCFYDYGNQLYIQAGLPHVNTAIYDDLSFKK